MTKINPDEIKTIIATDCGSTTTKAILIERQPNGEYRLTTRGEAPTTVEAPLEDVTIGVLNAFREVQELRNKKILTNDYKNLIKPDNGKEGVDIYVSTSSAGGGLQMVVAGVVKEMSAESAQRAALGGGAIVLDTFAVNDGRKPFERIEKIRELRPDIILLSGGTDGGTVKHVVEMAQLIAAARPKPRLGITYQLPVIFAGNKNAREEISRILSKLVELRIADNLRPTLDEENLQPARLIIQELFLEHVMAQAPGYKKLMEMVDVEIMPTPAAVGLIMQKISKKNNINLVGVDIGGATTDVFSVIKQDNEWIFNRSVSANYGMSYSIAQVLKDAGIENVLRWIPFDTDIVQLRNAIKNKMIRPTTIPYLLKDLMIEQAICREALKLSFAQHKLLAVGLKGRRKERSISDAFSQTESGETIIDMFELDMIVGSGGVLSHAPRRNQSAMMMIDAFEPYGFTLLTVDSIFMMPHLGVLSTVHEKAATEVFEKDCLIYLGTCICPVGKEKEGVKILEAEVIDTESNKTYDVTLLSGEIKVVPIKGNAKINIKYLHNKFKLSREEKIDTKEVKGGVVGIIFDGRGRPLTLPKNDTERKEKLNQWFKSINMYP
ncbi:MAG: glutamate mutase L [Candidatus Calescibacterium sp.]|nr:glutamate mutase L [Candidatus Calescibacterium sp.]MCX7972429.1 glutamate mutase L [bacterium]MDW8195680.1 glutamate mutase L [Candidatus Calescibacterium sp.]